MRRRFSSPNASFLLALSLAVGKMSPAAEVGDPGTLSDRMPLWTVSLSGEKPILSSRPSAHSQQQHYLPYGRRQVLPRAIPSAGFSGGQTGLLFGRGARR